MKKISDCFGKIKKWMDSHKTLVALFVTALFVLVHIPLFLAHEYTSDEGTVWGISKQINFSNIYEVNSVEPHPLLWEIILAPFAQNGFPMAAMSIVSLVVVALAVFLFVRFAPFGAFTKLIFLLSSAFFYYNPMFSRDYSLIPLAACLVCLAYQKRHEKPFRYGLALALLSQTHFLMYGFLAALVIGFVIEETFRKEKFKKMLLSILLVVVPVGLAVSSTIPMVVGVFNNHAIVSERQSLIETNKTSVYESAIGNFFGVYVQVLEIVMIVYAVIAVFMIFADNVKAGIYPIIGIAFWFFVMGNFYPNYYYMNQKLSVVVAIMLMTAWFVSVEKTKENIFSKILKHSELVKLIKTKMNLSVFFIVLPVFFMIPHVIVNTVKDLNMPYTTSNEIAGFINENIEENSVIIELERGASIYIDSAVYGQLKKNVTFYNIPLDTLNDYPIKMKYDGTEDKKYAEFKRLNDEEVQVLIDASLARYEHVYILTVLGGCSGDATYNKVLDKYESVKIFNDKEYLNGYKAKMKMYKIR